ncbi:DUF1127 domain-containing protein [Bradyrhizobium valentinum]|uniref:DUF1127 domain-containing protein n=1 Tax=Bradyrhizobium valentinum TaxID=1518501 RepID=UPI0012E34703|nr:DUF1127 domain-containing protein [Bradyrhizobium valentinum]
MSRRCEGSAGYLGRRIAIACLHDLDDRALRDIGLARSQIEPASGSWWRFVCSPSPVACG